MSEHEKNKEEIIENFLKVEKNLKKGEPLGFVQISPIDFCLSHYTCGNCSLCSSIFSNYSQRVDDDIDCPKIFRKSSKRKDLANMLFIGNLKIEKEEEKKKFFFLLFINTVLKDIEIKNGHTSFLLNTIEKVLKDSQDISRFDFEYYYDERVDWKFLLLKILGF